jgi:putative membrane protein
VILAVPVLWRTRERFPLTLLLYALIALHAVVLMVGGAYSCARVPLGFDIAQWFDLHRNQYD